eukprot:54306-Pelagomonas_calceolata.AAC.8
MSVMHGTVLLNQSLSQPPLSCLFSKLSLAMERGAASGVCLHGRQCQQWPAHAHSQARDNKQRAAVPAGVQEHRQMRGHARIRRHGWAHREEDAPDKC